MKKVGILKKAAKHLKGDMKTWKGLSKEASSEAKSDQKLIKSMKKVGKKCR